jgi:hypothetical protein
MWSIPFGEMESDPIDSLIALISGWSMIAVNRTIRTATGAPVESTLAPGK